MVATNFNGVFSCAARENGSDTTTANSAERVRFMRALRSDTILRVQQKTESRQDHANATPHLQARQRNTTLRLCIRLSPLYDFAGIERDFPLISPFQLNIN